MRGPARAPRVWTATFTAPRVLDDERLADVFEEMSEALRLLAR